VVSAEKLTTEGFGVLSVPRCGAAGVFSEVHVGRPAQAGGARGPREFQEYACMRPQSIATPTGAGVHDQM